MRVSVCHAFYLYIYIYNVYLRSFFSCVAYIHTYIYGLLQGTGSLHTYLFFPHGLHTLW